MSLEQFMQRMGAEKHAGGLPAASTIWWRAEFRRRFEAERRATCPIRIATAAAYAACVIAAAVLSAKFGRLVPFVVGIHAVLTVGGVVLARRSESR